MDATEAQWRRDFVRAHDAIKPKWLWTDADGWTGIAPEHAEHPLVKHYIRHCQVGFARGWM